MLSLEIESTGQDYYHAKKIIKVFEKHLGPVQQMETNLQMIFTVRITMDAQVIPFQVLITKESALLLT
jgi:hypothetical protein